MVVTLELVEGFLLIGANHIGDILRGVKIADAGAGMLRENEVADRMDQVRLAKTHATVDEQRIVRRSRMFGDLQRRAAGAGGFAGSEAPGDSRVIDTRIGEEKNSAPIASMRGAKRSLTHCRTKRLGASSRNSPEGAAEASSLSGRIQVLNC